MCHSCGKITIFKTNKSFHNISGQRNLQFANLILCSFHQSVYLTMIGFQTGEHNILYPTKSICIQAPLSLHKNLPIIINYSITPVFSDCFWIYPSYPKNVSSIFPLVSPMSFFPSRFTVPTPQAPPGAPGTWSQMLSGFASTPAPNGAISIPGTAAHRVLTPSWMALATNS